MNKQQPGFRPKGRRPAEDPLLVGGRQEEEQELRDYEKYGSSGWRVVAGVMGVLAFFGLLIVTSVGLWRLQVQQNDISELDQRLMIAEELLIHHTDQIAVLNSTLITTIAQVVDNTQRIGTLNATQITDEGRISSLENRTTLLEARLTVDEIKLLGVMNNVTVLQAQMAQAIINITVLQSEVTILQGNVSQQGSRLNVLEAEYAAQQVQLNQLAAWLQGNLTIIDARLDILNITYVVTGSGRATVESGVAIPSQVTWQTRHFAHVGLDVEYLWISTTNYNPTQIRLANSSLYSFQVTNFTLTSPVGVLPAPSAFLERPLGPFQQSKFLLQSFNPAPRVLSAAWDNVNVALNFRSNLALFDAVTITAPLTFIIGFL